MPELAPLIVQAYDLTKRERLVTECVAQGLSTAAIGRRQVGVSNRGELVAKLFVDHYRCRACGATCQPARQTDSGPPRISRMRSMHSAGSGPYRAAATFSST